MSESQLRAILIGIGIYFIVVVVFAITAMILGTRSKDEVRLARARTSLAVVAGLAVTLFVSSWIGR